VRLFFRNFLRAGSELRRIPKIRELPNIHLQAEDVLEEAEESRELGEGPFYTITLRGMQMLREV
jgi:hypothetical protein